VDAFQMSSFEGLSSQVTNSNVFACTGWAAIGPRFAIPFGVLKVSTYVPTRNAPEKMRILIIPHAMNHTSQHTDAQKKPDSAMVANLLNRHGVQVA